MAKKIAITTRMPPPTDAPRPLPRMAPERSSAQVVSYPGAPPPMMGPPMTDRPRLAGILLIVAGLVLIGYTGFILSLGSETTDSLVDNAIDKQGGDMNETKKQETKDLVRTVMTACYIGMILMGVIVVLAGVMAMMRRMWGFAMVGAVLAVLGISAFFIPTILGVVALYFLYKSKAEFQSTGYS